MLKILILEAGELKPGVMYEADLILQEEESGRFKVVKNRYADIPQGRDSSISPSDVPDFIKTTQKQKDEREAIR